MKADKTLLQMTYPCIIEAFAELQKISRRQALELFYKSNLYKEVREGISDMHCRSEKYLADELMLEYKSI